MPTGQDNSDAIIAIERQLGRVVGQLESTVGAVETLRASIERMVERVAFKQDFEVHRDDSRRESGNLWEAVNELRAEMRGIVRWMWICIGGFTAIGALLKFVQIPVRLSVGG